MIHARSSPSQMRLQKVSVDGGKADINRYFAAPSSQSSLNSPARRC
jgi:hypothetical protein